MFGEIVRSVHVVGGDRYSDPSDCLVYALDLGDVVLVDCGLGPGWQRIRENLAGVGLKPERLHTLLLTHAHADHIGAAPLVVRDTGCRVVAHELDARAISEGDNLRTAANWYQVRLEPVHIDQIVRGAGAVLSFKRGELHLVHTPGHTPGSMAAWVDLPDGRVLFGQDIHGPFHPAFESDLDDWRESMQRLLELEADVLCEGHFGVYHGKDKVHAFIEQHLARNPA